MPFKKFLLFFLVSSYLFLVTSYFSPIFAQSPDLSSTELSQFEKIQNAGKMGQKTLERWDEDFNISLLMSILRAFIGEIPQEFFDAIKQIKLNGRGTLPKIQPLGAIGQGTQMIAAIFTPPASGVEYLAGLKDNLLGKPAYAQGFGFKGLEFLLPLWKAARNLVYILSSIIFVVIGLMIILRVKVSPQAVVTIQSAIPQVITTLILVTFSYAIAGLMIDVGNLIAGTVIALLFNAQDTNLSQNLFTTLATPSTLPWVGGLVNVFNSWVTSFQAFLGYSPLKFTDLVNPSFNTMTVLTQRVTPNWFSIALLSGLVGGAITPLFLPIAGFSWFVGSAVGGILGALIIPIIISIMVIIWLIKLYFGLIKVYVTLLFKIISGPLEIAMGAFPNAKTGFSTWLLDVFANVMVFPVIMIFMIILNILTDAINNGGTVWVPGVLNSGNEMMAPILSACVALAGLALISKLPEMIPQYIFMIKPSPWGDAIGKAGPEAIAGMYNTTNASAKLAEQIGKARNIWKQGELPKTSTPNQSQEAR